MSRIKNLLTTIHRYYSSKSIQFMISISFTLVAIGCMVIMGVFLYTQFAINLRQTIIQENNQLVNQIVLNINNYTAKMRGISDSMYYNVIKNSDIAEKNLSGEMSLLYEANKSDLVSVACFDKNGNIVAAAPNANIKPGVAPKGQKWYNQATTIIENSHFSTPHVQNLFSDDKQRYHWVISLSRMVELTESGNTQPGVLLVDMSFSGIETIFRQMEDDEIGYVYLIDKQGEIIYHPKQRLIYSGIYHENNLAAAGYSDGIYEETFDGTQRQIIVRQVGYTGWRVISVIPNSAFSIGFSQMQMLIIAVTGIGIMLLVIVNSFVSSRVANPIKKLDKSVRDLEKGSVDLDIYIGGPYEIEHLGRTIRSAVDQMRKLMDDVVREQELQRRSEFDALQAQINPHFLYNTLDSIVWMIESGRQREAISMVTALASLFRISLSKGKTIIPVKTELEHARYYLHIQNIRYKNKFTVDMDIDPEIENCSTIKLVLQPLIENAIYYAMELMDGDGKITISGWRQGGDIFLQVKDNGLGMTQEKVDTLLSGKSKPGRKGSGIGLINVHQRIQIYYGKPYGLKIESEPDVGTKVTIRLPYNTPDSAQPSGVNL